MKNRSFALAAACIALVAIGAWLAVRAHRGTSAIGTAPSASRGAPSQRSLTDDLRRSGLLVGDADTSEPPDRPSVALPAVPRGVEDLRALVAWMRTLGREELMRLTNAEFHFQKSELVEMLRTLEGDWVIPELGRLAAGENDDLIKATLVMGLSDGFAPSRTHDPRLLTEIERLLPQMSTAALDPFDVGRFLVSGSYAACVAQHRDLGAILAPHLESSDNPMFLSNGYMMIGVSGSSPDLLSRMLTEHANEHGRLGALEGLRQAHDGAKLPPEEITRLSLGALQTETSDRNRVLLIELMGSCGGEAGLAQLADIVKSGTSGMVGSAATMLAVKLDPDRAREVLDDALKNSAISAADRGALYQAIGVVPGTESQKKLLDLAGDRSLSDSERRQALQGLWNQPMDEGLSKQLTDIVAGDAPGGVRAESLRMLAFSRPGDAPVDTRSIAESDKDPSVRQEAVMLSAIQPGQDKRGWLEERFLNDSSPDVKAAALGALVMQAHYAGDGDAALGHLARVRQQTSDPAVLAMIDRGEQLVRSYDPRRVDLELKREAQTYATVARYTSGPVQREMQRQADYYQRIISSLNNATNAGAANK